MHFHKDAVRAGHHARLRENRNKAPVAAGAFPQAPRGLHGMRRVKNNRKTKRLHDRNRLKIIDKMLVTEARSAFRQKNFTASDFFKFLDDIFCIPGGKELALFDIYDPSGFSGGEN